MAQAIKINLPGKKRSEVQVEIRKDELHITGVPDRDTLEFVAQGKTYESIFYVMHRPKRSFSSILTPRRYRLHIGSEDEMMEAQVLDVREVRTDGVEAMEVHYEVEDAYLIYGANGLYNSLEKHRILDKEDANLWIPRNVELSPWINGTEKDFSDRLIKLF